MKQVNPSFERADLYRLDTAKNVFVITSSLHAAVCAYDRAVRSSLVADSRRAAGPFGIECPSFLAAAAAQLGAPNAAVT